MVAPAFAIVRPRVISPHSGEVLLLEDVVSSHLADGDRGAIEIVGGPLSGKTTAMEYLGRLFFDERNLTLIDGEAQLQPCVGAPGQLTVSSSPEYAPPLIARYRLAPWGQDEWLEYLLAAHKERCGSVMSRLADRNSQGTLAGNAHLWRLVLDELAASETIPSADIALRIVLDRLFASCEVREKVREFALVATARLPNEPDELDRVTRQLATQRIERQHLRLLGLDAVQIFLAAEALVVHLREEGPPTHLQRLFPAALLREFSLDVQADHALRLKLENALVGNDRTQHAMAASLLYAADAKWLPTRRTIVTVPPAEDESLDLPNLNHAVFEGANWPRIDLHRACLVQAQLSQANLECANLASAQLEFANFAGAKLRGVILDQANAFRANFANADMAFSRAPEARLQGDFSSVDFEGAQLSGADFTGANLTYARFVRANLARTSFAQADITNADFTRANLTRSWLKGLDLRGACFDDAVLSHATLAECNLEGMRLAGLQFERANFRDALLTGSNLSRANLRGARLQGAGLADVEWQGVDLRDADLRGASFHLGSTRCGLVDSPYPSHGTRTGFYTDDYNEQDFKAPEEIRKANLCGADLRGAKIAGVDFYLVDLRDAQLDPSQLQHLRQCGAILQARAASPTSDLKTHLLPGTTHLSPSHPRLPNNRPMGTRYRANNQYPASNPYRSNGQPVGAKTQPSPTARYACRNVSSPFVCRPSGNTP